MTQRRLIVGISGASGVTYGVRLLQLLRNAGLETHLVMSKTAALTFAYETSLKIADVTLKERRRLVLMVRETPLHTGHLRTMTALSEMGAIIAPPVPAFYARPETLQDMVDHTVGRVLDLFEIDVGVVQRWGETPELHSCPRRDAQALRPR